jgi:glycosyltransferase involved in cell wall biosynthesis
VRILVVAPHPFFQNRGTPIAVRALVQVLSGLGHRVDLLTYHEGQDETIDGVEHHRIADLPVSNIRPGFSIKKLVCDVALSVKCLELLRGRRFDLVHAVEESAFLAVLIKWIYGIPFVYDMDSSLAQQMVERFSWLDRASGFLEGCEGLAVRESLGVVAVCRSLQEIALGYQDDKLSLCLEDFSLLKPSPGFDDGELLVDVPGPRAMYVGNLEPYQGLDLLLESFQTVKRVGPGSLVVIGGAERDIAHYRKEAGRLGIDDRVFFVGPRPVEHLGAYLEMSDVVVSPRIQGFNTPMKIYSYLDSGRAVLATRLPTHTQVLDDEIACLVDPDPESMGQGLVRLFREPELAERLARQAGERVQREFTFEAYSRKLAGFYRTVEQNLLIQRQ